MRKIRTWQLCRSGVFGQDGAPITKQDLRDIQETFTPPRPVTIGHDAARSDNIPKFGDVLAIDGIYPDPKHPGEDVLVGDVILHPALDAHFDDKHDGTKEYEGWSVTIPHRGADGRRYLHSLAICGATPPKIPGLEQLMIKNDFSEGDTVEVVNFGDAINFEEDTMAAKPMTDAEKIAALEKENADLKKQADDAAKKNEHADPAPAADNAAAQKERQEFDDVKKRCETLEKENHNARVNGFIGKIEGKVPAGIMPKAKALAEQFADAQECEFADGTETKKSSALDLFADILTSGFKADPAVVKPVYIPGSSDFSDAKGSDGKPIDWNSLAAKM